ncbi:hypothetical protein INR49_022768 [Caranx melampygus]|nr:hypothetical protein INR49_022768 [Caranx melampygus]
MFVYYELIVWLPPPQFVVYRKSSAENMPLARRRIESLDASYGCSLDGISRTAGIDCMWASMA